MYRESINSFTIMELPVTHLKREKSPLRTHTHIHSMPQYTRFTERVREREGKPPLGGAKKDPFFLLSWTFNQGGRAFSPLLAAASAAAEVVAAAAVAAKRRRTYRKQITRSSLLVMDWNKWERCSSRCSCTLSPRSIPSRRSVTSVARFCVFFIETALISLWVTEWKGPLVFTLLMALNRCLKTFQCCQKRISLVKLFLFKCFFLKWKVNVEKSFHIYTFLLEIGNFAFKSSGISASS